MLYEEAVAEEKRISGLLENNADYQYKYTVQPTYDDDGAELPNGWWVGVGWYAVVEDKEYGNMLAVGETGARIDPLRKALHHNYTYTMQHR